VSFNESQLERYSGVFLALFSIVIYFVIIPWQIRNIAGETITPRSFPSTITAVMFVLSVCLFISGWRKKDLTDQKNFQISREEILLAGATLLAVGGYNLLLYVIPYIPATIIVLAILIWLYGQRKLWKLGAVSVMLPVVIFVAFTYFLKLQLP
jgi:hypothetical protein